MTASATNENAWIDYWERLPPGRLLFAPEAAEFARNLQRAIPLNRSMRVLDYGCGYGAVPRLIAEHVKEIAYWDAAAGMRDAAARTLANVPNAALWQGDRGEFDLIVVNSVVQYMSGAELRERLSQ